MLAIWTPSLVVFIASLYVIARGIRFLCCKPVNRIRYLDDSIVVLLNPKTDPNGTTWGVIIGNRTSFHPTFRVSIRSAGQMGPGIYELRQFTTNPQFSPTSYLYGLDMCSAMELENQINDFLSPTP